jgi:hypothetical protein
MPIDKVDFYKDEMVRYTNGWLEDETLANLVIGNKLTRWTYGPQAAASGDEEALVSALRDEMQQTLNAPTSMTERIGLDSVKDRRSFRKMRYLRKGRRRMSRPSLALIGTQTKAAR